MDRRNDTTNSFSLHLSLMIFSKVRFEAEKIWLTQKFRFLRNDFIRSTRELCFSRYSEIVLQVDNYDMFECEDRKNPRQNYQF